MDRRPVRPPKPKAEEEYDMTPNFGPHFVLNDRTVASILSSMGQTEVETRTTAEHPPVATRSGKRKKRRADPVTSGYREKQRARVLDDELGTYIGLQSELFEETDWDGFVRQVRGRGDLVVPEEGSAVSEHPKTVSVPR